MRGIDIFFHQPTELDGHEERLNEVYGSIFEEILKEEQSTFKNEIRRKELISQFLASE